MVLTNEQRALLDYLYTRDTAWTWMGPAEWFERSTGKHQCILLERLGLAERHPNEQYGTKWRLSLAGIRAWMADEEIREHERKRACGEVRGCFYLTIRRTDDERREQA